MGILYAASLVYNIGKTRIVTKIISCFIESPFHHQNYNKFNTYNRYAKGGRNFPKRSFNGIKFRRPTGNKGNAENAFSSERCTTADPVFQHRKINVRDTNLTQSLERNTENTHKNRGDERKIKDGPEKRARGSEKFPIFRWRIENEAFKMAEAIGRI